MQSYYSWIHHSKQLLPSFIRSNRKYISFFIFFPTEPLLFFRLFCCRWPVAFTDRSICLTVCLVFLYILSSSRHEFCFSVIKITLEKKTFYYYKQTDDGACLTLRVVYIYIFQIGIWYERVDSTLINFAEESRKLGALHAFIYLSIW